MLTRQPPSTFTADSATAAGVATASHAKEKTRPGVRTPSRGESSRETRLLRDDKGFLRSVLLATVPLKEREIDFLDSSSAGVCSTGAEFAG